jgi:hypothetical protein
MAIAIVEVFVKILGFRMTARQDRRLCGGCEKIQYRYSNLPTHNCRRIQNLEKRLVVNLSKG